MDFQTAEKITPAFPAGETLKLNPNCCYKACPGCSSIRRLREFQGRHPADWERRLVGSARLLAAALQHERLPEMRASQPCDREGNCEECGAFGALDFGHIWLCPGCHAGKGACCSDFGEKSVER